MRAIPHPVCQRLLILVLTLLPHSTKGHGCSLHTWGHSILPAPHSLAEAGGSQLVLVLCPGFAALGPSASFPSGHSTRASTSPLP